MFLLLPYAKLVFNYLSMLIGRFRTCEDMELKANSKLFKAAFDRNQDYFYLDFRKRKPHNLKLI